MKPNIYLLTLLFVVCTLHKATSQRNNNLIESFFAGRQQFQNNFRSYVDSINVKFAEHLAKSWELFQIEVPVERPYKPEPKTLPVYIPDNSTTSITPVFVEEPVEVDTIYMETAPQKNERKFATASEGNSSIVEFFGTSITLPVVQGYETKSSGTDEKQVANYWLQLSKTNYPDFIDQINTKEIDLQLGSWGLYQLILEWAKRYFTKQQENEKAIFIVYMLNQAGYKAKIGRIRDALVVMVAFRNTIYGKPYIRSGNDYYYILSEQTIDKSLASYKLDYEPATSYIDLTIDKLPQLAVNSSTVKRIFRNNTYSFTYNNSLTDYYHTFPQTELKIYANTPLSIIAKEGIIKELADDLMNKSDPDKVKFILSLIQNGFAYKNDEEQFGYEKYFFAEEALYYPFSDCEDRAILFCRMVKLLCDLDTLIVDYPTHVAAAVKLEVPGDAIIYNNSRYVICDPSFIGAPIAKTMANCDNTKAKVFVVR